MIKTILLSAFLSLIPLASFASTPVEFIIDGIEGEQGNLIIAIFDREEVWLDQPKALLIINRPVTEAENGRLVYKTNVKLPSKVSISVYQDLDTDNELNTNFLGQPTEPYGFANNVRPATRPATFEEAQKTILNNSKITIEIKK